MPLTIKNIAVTQATKEIKCLSKPSPTVIHKSHADSLKSIGIDISKSDGYLITNEIGK